MAEELDAIQEIDPPSSERAEQDVAKTVEKPVETEAASSSATDETPADTLSIVRDVVSKTKAVAEAAGSSPDGEERKAAAEADADPPTPDDTDFTDVPFHKHPRFQQLLRQKREYEQDAVRYRNVEKFISDHDMRPDEAADALQIAALAKVNPVQAWERIKPWVESLAVAAGAILPPDLQQRVAAGELKPEAALELSQARASRGAFESQRGFDQRRTEQQQLEAQRSAVTSAADTWENQRRIRDPNFDAKVPALQREIAFLHATEGKANNPAGVQAQLEKAYKAVNASFKPVQPAVVPKRTIKPVTGGQVAGTPNAKPDDTLGIIEARLGGG